MFLSIYYEQGWYEFYKTSYGRFKNNYCNVRLDTLMSFVIPAYTYNWSVWYEIQNYVIIMAKKPNHTHGLLLWQVN